MNNQLLYYENFFYFTGKFRREIFRSLTVGPTKRIKMGSKLTTFLAFIGNDLYVFIQGFIIGENFPFLL